ncbi:4Fe-4S dicluster domain-containing protein [Chloroflexota bacterium]
MSKVYVNPDVCIGCGLCSVYCRVEHSDTKDMIKALNRESVQPRIRVEREGINCFSMQCRQCDEPWCVYSCLTGALSKNAATGGVEYAANKCVGCWTCVMVCPNGMLSRDVASHLIAKCDLCPECDIPACVANCPNEALVLVTDDGQVIVGSPDDVGVESIVID